jgi:predicted CoA-binding protein
LSSSDIDLGKAGWEGVKRIDQDIDMISEYKGQNTVSTQNLTVFSFVEHNIASIWKQTGNCCSNRLSELKF